ncbi:hypothetical protein THRCLA_03451 [Thraustotheca clavata]|uniref:Mitochondrial protein n=1 Tax=Thraustotheca clavata TaxID=74557 RepID=A0A1W0A221_9STRA|nr:hypothetical protein THRCLA_03451 [Thraustotheca clavata]
MSRRHLASLTRTSHRLEKLHGYLKSGDVGSAMQLASLSPTSKLDGILDFVVKVNAIDPVLAKDTSAFFVRKDTQLAPDLTRAYASKDLVLPHVAIKDILMALTQIHDTRAVLQILAMAYKNKLIVSPAAMLQCFVMCRSSPEHVAMNPHPLIEPFVKLAKLGLVDITYPRLGEVILEICLKHGSVDDALKCYPIVKAELSTHMINLIDNLAKLCDSPDVQSMWIQFALCNKREIAEQLLESIQSSKVDPSSKLYCDLGKALFRQGKYNLGCAAIEAALVKNEAIPSSVFTIGFQGMTVSSYGLDSLLNLFWRAQKSNLLSDGASEKCVEVAIRACLRYNEIDQALELHRLRSNSSEEEPSRFTAVLNYLEQAPEPCHLLIVDFLVHRRLDIAMALYNKLNDANVVITSKTLTNILITVKHNADDVAIILQYALKHQVRLPAAVATAILAKGGRDYEGVVIGFLNLMQANLIPINGIILSAMFTEHSQHNDLRSRAITMAHSQVNIMLEESATQNQVDITGLVAFLFLQEPETSMQLFQRCAQVKMVLLPRTLVTLIRHGVLDDEINEVLEHAKATQCILPGSLVSEILAKFGHNPSTLTCLVNLMSSRLITINRNILRSILYASNDPQLIEKCVEISKEQGVSMSSP